MRAFAAAAICLGVLSGCYTISPEFPSKRLYSYEPEEASYISLIWWRDIIYLVPPSVRSAEDARRINVTTGEVMTPLPYHVNDPEMTVLWGPAAFSPDGSMMGRILERAEQQEWTVAFYEPRTDGSFRKVGEKPCPDFQMSPSGAKAEGRSYWPFWMVWASGKKQFYSICRGDRLQRWSCEEKRWEDVMRADAHRTSWLTPVSGGRVLVRVQGDSQEIGDRFFVADAEDRWHLIVRVESAFFIKTMILSPDLNYAAMALRTGGGGSESSPTDAWLIRLRDGKMLKLLHSEPGIMSAAFSPDGSKLACFSWCRSGQMDRKVLTRSYLDVIHLDKACQLMDSDAPLPYQSEIDRACEILKPKTWRYEDAPVLTLDEVRATAYDPLRKQADPAQGGDKGPK